MLSPAVVPALWGVVGRGSLPLTRSRVLFPTESPASSRVTRSSGRQPTILSLFSKGSVRWQGWELHLLYRIPPGAFTLIFLSPPSGA